MENWEICEKECFEYLKKKFSSSIFSFEQIGGSNSSKSDILLNKNGIALFYIESKMKKAQCGQFVALADEKDNIFVYSRANKYDENLQSSIILDKMSKDFEKYNNPGTAGKDIQIDKSYFYDWIYHYYKDNKNVKYFILEKSVGNNNLNDDNFVIIPIEHFNQYFNVNATYRIKKSGSQNPCEKDFDNIKKALKSQGFNVINIFKKEKYTFVEFKAASMNYKIPTENHTYQFKWVENNLFKVTRLSNTNNANVIFDIELIKEQDSLDLKDRKSVV